MKLEYLNRQIKSLESEQENPRIDPITGDGLNNVETSELDIIDEDKIKGLEKQKQAILNTDNKITGQARIKKDVKKNEQFEKDMDKNKSVSEMATQLLDVPESGIASQLKKQTPQHELDLLLMANDSEFKPLLTQYCSKTGRLIGHVELTGLQRLINIHSRERALEILRIKAVEHVSFEWLHTEPETLNQLMYQDPAGYFVYSTAQFFHTDLIIKSNQGTRPPNTSNKNVDELDTFMLGLKDFPTVDNAAELDFHVLPVKDKQRYLNLDDKIEARKFLDQLTFLSPDVESTIVEANELIRRLIGLANAENIAKHCKFTFVSILECSENLEEFIDQLKLALKTIFIQFFKGMHYTKAEFIIERLRTRTITAGNIAQIKSEFKGLTNFHKQPKIKGLSKSQQTQQAILHDLMNFWDDQTETNADLKQFKSQPRIPEKINQSIEATQNEIDSLTNRKSIKTDKPFKLNLGGK